MLISDKELDAQHAEQRAHQRSAHEERVRALIQVSAYCYMCPQTTIYVSSSSYISACSYYNICVLIFEFARSSGHEASHAASA